MGTRISEIRGRHKRNLRLAADKEARERYFLGLATLAAGTAHEMGTPLSTMALIVGDLRRSDTPPPDWRESMEVLWQQIQACKRSLSGLAAIERLGGTATMFDREDGGVRVQVELPAFRKVA